MSWDATVLADSDNVAVALRRLEAGERVTVHAPARALEVTVRETVPLFHKLAIADIAAGADIRKYGQRIGQSRDAIRAGSWVHVHNLASCRASAAHSA